VERFITPPLRRAITSVVIFALLLFSMSCKREIKTSEVSAKAKPAVKPTYYCPLDGTRVEEKLSKRPVAVMVENLESIRPQSGLSQACLVIEALAEGGITRFMAVYGHHEPREVGPVRSARTHYVAIAKGFDALYAHCGASTYAEEAIRNWNVLDFDQFRYPQGFWRVSSRPRPHNLFTDVGRIRRVAAESGLEIEGEMQGWSFKADLSLAQRPEGQTISISFSSGAYQVEYTYDRAQNSYLRRNGGQAHLDGLNSEQLAPKNVIVLFVPTTLVSFGNGLLNVEIVGGGEALFFQDGKAVEGTWRKASADDQFRFTYGEGDELKLNRGQTWIEVVKTDTPVVHQTLDGKGDELEDSGNGE
jgi:hypothetical protein